MGQRRRIRHNPEQIVKKLRDADAMLKAGKDLAAVLQALEISESTFAYDAANRRIRTKDPNAKIWTSTYDAAGRAVGSIRPSLSRMTQVYDDDNRPTVVIDANNHRLSYVYDERGLRRSIRFPSPQPPVTYGYDEGGWRTLRIDGRGNRTTYTFDKLGRETAWDYPSGQDCTFTYDSLSRMTARRDRSGMYTMTCHPLGEQQSESRAGVRSRFRRLGRREFGRG